MPPGRGHRDDHQHRPEGARVSETTPEEQPGKTPSAPDVDQPDGGTGEDGKTPSNADGDIGDGAEL